MCREAPNNSKSRSAVHPFPDYIKGCHWTTRSSTWCAARTSTGPPLLRAATRVGTAATVARARVPRTFRGRPPGRRPNVEVRRAEDREDARERASPPFRAAHARTRRDWRRRSASLFLLARTRGRRPPAPQSLALYIAAAASQQQQRYLVDPASNHMLVSKIKPCMSKYKPRTRRDCGRLIKSVTTPLGTGAPRG